MQGITLLLVAAIGVDVGWKPVENGELEYIIQIAPEQLRSLKTGDVIEVGVRPMLRPVRRYRIVVGTDPLPRQSARPETKNTASDSGAAKPPSSVNGDVSLLKTPDSGGVKSKSPDHSIVVAPQKSPDASDDPRWVAAHEDHEALQLQSIPTQPIRPLVEPPPIPANQLDILPPPPSVARSAQEVTTPPSAGDAFVPNYRMREGREDFTENQKDYRIGDSVPIDQGTIQASGIVPPTSRLILPPPPEGAKAIAADSTQVAPLQLPPPPEQTPQSAQEVPVPRPMTPEEQKAYAPSEQPNVLKTAAAPAQVDSNIAVHSAPTTPRKQDAAEAEPSAPSDGHSGGTWLLLALFASIGGNIFLGYITWDIRKRFLAAFGENTTESSNEPHEVAGR